MTIDTVFDYCLSKPFVKLDYPFGPDPAVFKVGGKMIALVNEKDGQARITMKCEPMLADLLRQQYTSVIKAFKSDTWNCVLCDGGISDYEIIRQIDLSYDLVWKSLTKKKREQLKRESHPLYLFPDPDYQPLEILDGDESFPNGYFIFHITLLLKHIAANREEYTLGIARIEDYMAFKKPIEPRKCVTADLRQPILLAEISPGRYNIIDGHHRLSKARNMGKAALPAYMLPPRQHSLFITEQKAYDAYIEYWNGKLFA
jgi:predicted DNA-binding protein (MmcQ/YjbR family)